MSSYIQVTLPYTKFVCILKEFQSHSCNFFGMLSSISFWQARNNHVGISNRFNLFLQEKMNGSTNGYQLVPLCRLLV